jgi:hypothetical protein
VKENALADAAIFCNMVVDDLVWACENGRCYPMEALESLDELARLFTMSGLPGSLRARIESLRSEMAAQVSN